MWDTWWEWDSSRGHLLKVPPGYLVGDLGLDEGVPLQTGHVGSQSRTASFAVLDLLFHVNAECEGRKEGRELGALLFRSELLTSERICLLILSANQNPKQTKNQELCKRRERR